MNFEAFRNHNFQKFQNSKNFDFDPENTLRRPKIHQSGTRLRGSMKWKHCGAKHSPSESPLGGNIGKPGGPPVCVAWTPLDRFFSYWKNVPEVILLWDCHDFWRSFAWRSRFFLWRDRNTQVKAPYWSLFGGHDDRKHKNEHQEAPTWFQMNPKWFKINLKWILKRSEITIFKNFKIRKFSISTPKTGEPRFGLCLARGRSEEAREE